MQILMRIITVNNCHSILNLNILNYCVECLITLSFFEDCRKNIKLNQYT